MNENKDKVIAVLFTRPEYHFHLRELARLTKLNPNTIITITDRLQKEGLAVKRKFKSLMEIFCSTDSPAYRRKKKLFNLSQVQDSGLVDFLVQFYNHPHAIILFGSYARGEDLSTSDIDLAIITAAKKKPPLTAWEKKLHRPLHLLTLEYKDISSELYQNLINGMVLSGYLKIN